MIKENFSLKQYNTFGIDVLAQFFSTFSSIEELGELLNYKSSLPTTVPKLILGGGSNILFTENFKGLVLKNEIHGIEKIAEDENYVYVKAGAGENWHQLVMYCVNNNLGGMENLSLIPGNVGASPMQNIGAYGVEIKDIFYELEAYHFTDKKTIKFGLNDCDFGYRESIFKRKLKGEFAIVNVTYKLRKIPIFNTSYGSIEQELALMKVLDLSIAAISQAVINIRRSKLPDPAVIGNAGSFFKNPEIDATVFKSLKILYPNIIGYLLDNGQVKLAAGWLIEQCGWKNYRIDDAGCHAKQALVLVNYGHAKGTEILELSDKIIKSVENKFGIQLSKEVNII